MYRMRNYAIKIPLFLGAVAIHRPTHVRY
ncbi:MAG: stage V sporulation protein M [Firmicutes bacterium]|nr:stage V sporulation protein M [Candidatus Fermentithermobacillaceae bacterium]